MLATQFLSPGPSGFYGPSGALGDTASDVKLLQQTLINAGKTDVKVTGSMDGKTAAGAYEIIRDKAGAVGGAIASLASQGAGDAIKNIWKTIQAVDSALGSVNLGIADLLRDLNKVQPAIDAANAVCSAYSDSDICGYVETLSGDIKSFMDDLTSEIGTINKVMKILVPKAVPTTTSTTAAKRITMLRALSPIYASGMAPQAYAPPTPTAPTPPPAPVVAPGTIYFHDTKLNKYRIAVPKTPIPATPAAPAHYGFGGLGVMDGDHCVFGDCGLNAAATYMEIAPSTTAPGAPAVLVTETDFQTKTGTLPVYKTWWFWTILGVAVIGGGGATFWLIRRRKKAGTPAKAAAPAAAKAAW